MNNALKIIAICIACTASCFAQAQAPQTQQTPQPIDLKTVPPQTFLAAIRDPLRADAWSVITGRVVHARGEEDLVKGNVRLSIRLSPQKMITQITLDDKNTYILEQAYDKQTNKTKLDLEMPLKEEKPTLKDLGIAPDDLSFAFFYWDFIEELTTNDDFANGIRVMRLRNPADPNASVKVNFNSKHGFPVEAVWLDAQSNIQRKLELKGAKRHKNGVWFVKEMRLEDGAKTWKTQVRFDYVEKNEIGE